RKAPETGTWCTREPNSGDAWTWAASSNNQCGLDHCNQECKGCQSACAPNGQEQPASSEEPRSESNPRAADGKYGSGHASAAKTSLGSGRRNPACGSI